MGVASLRGYLDKYAAADESSKEIAKRLIALEESLSTQMRDFLLIQRVFALASRAPMRYNRKDIKRTKGARSMKKYRPLNAGYILVYVVVIAVIVQGIWTLIAMMLRQGAARRKTPSPACWTCGR